MKKKRIILSCILFLLLACISFPVLGEENPWNEQNWQTLLTERYWVNDFQAITYYEFTPDGEFYSFYRTGGDSDVYTSDSLINASFVPSPENISEKKFEGNYRIQDDIITLSFYRRYTLDLRIQDPSIDADYLNLFNGKYFMIDNNFVPTGNVEESPFYLFGIGGITGETVSSPSALTNDSSSVKDSPLGYYVYDLGSMQEIIRIDSIDNGIIRGKYLFVTATGEDYGIRDFSWDIVSSSPLISEELFQNQSDHIRYEIGQDILVTYPEGWWEPRIYRYICNLDQPENYISHPQLNLIIDFNDQPAPVPTAFYGIWTIGSKAYADCEQEAAALRNAGFPAAIYLTTDWSNLNPEPWYVVSAGEYATESEADAVLGSVQAIGRYDAYVKYSGEHY